MAVQNFNIELKKTQEERAAAQIALQRSQKKLKEVQQDNHRKRDKAQVKLRTAETRLREIQQAIKKLESEESRIAEEQKKNDDVQTDAARRDRLVEADQDQQNEIITAEERLSSSTDRSRKAEHDSNNLETQKRPTDEERKRPRERKESIERQLSEKRKEETDATRQIPIEKSNLEAVINENKRTELEAATEIREAKEDLEKRQEAVTKAVVKINSRVTTLPRQFRKKISQLSNTQQFFGGTGIGYPYILLLGALYEFVFYRAHGINIFNYSTISDFTSHRSFFLRCGFRPGSVYFLYDRCEAILLLYTSSSRNGCRISPPARRLWTFDDASRRLFGPPSPHRRCFVWLFQLHERCQERGIRERGLNSD